MRLVKFVIYRDEESGWYAKAIDANIVTQGETLDKLRENIKEAVEVHFEEEIPTETIKILTLSEFEVLPSIKTGSS